MKQVMLLCVSTFILLSLMTSPTVNAVDNLVPDTCKNISTSNPKIKYDFCIKELEEDPRSSTATLPVLTQISFELGVYKGKAVTSWIYNILNDPRLSPGAKVKKELEECLGLYKHSIDELNEGLKAARDSGDYKTANVKASGALTDAGTCKDKFHDGGGYVSLPDEDFSELVSIILALINMV